MRTCEVGGMCLCLSIACLPRCRGKEEMRARLCLAAGVPAQHACVRTASDCGGVSRCTVNTHVHCCTPSSAALQQCRCLTICKGRCMHPPPPTQSRSVWVRKDGWLCAVPTAAHTPKAIAMTERISTHVCSSRQSHKTTKSAPASAAACEGHDSPSAWLGGASPMWLGRIGWESWRGWGVAAVLLCRICTCHCKHMRHGSGPLLTGIQSWPCV